MGLHICHLSLLNPAIHSRIFFKMARSQVRAGYRVTIVAQDSARVPYMREGVQIIPIGVFGRMSWRRIWAVFKIARIAERLAADIYQVHTVELLSTVQKIKQKLSRTKVIFDMHEDYVANILHADYYGEYSRKPLAQRVQRAQLDFAQWGDGLFLAEDCFQSLIPFDAERTAVVRNKYQAPEATSIEYKTGPAGLPFLLVTGTIAENWGIFKAVDLWAALNLARPLGLVIAGHGQDKAVLQELERRVLASGYGNRFLLVGGERYLPYEEVVKYIEACTFGLALYTLKENIKDRIPTKFYEFMAHQKPLLFTANPAWDAMNERYDFGMHMEWPLTPNALERIDAAFWAGSGSFYRKPMTQADWSWDSEATTMLALIQRITN